MLAYFAYIKEFHSPLDLISKTVKAKKIKLNIKK